MTERRKYVGTERRGRAGKVFEKLEEIRKDRTRAIEKLHEYEFDEGVGTKWFFPFVIVIAFIAVAGIFRENPLLLLTGIIGAIVTTGIGIARTRIALRKAREKFKKENLHLAKYLPS